MQPPLEFSKKTPLTRRCENAKKRLFGGSCFAAWNIISAKNFFAESLWFIDDQGPHFEGMIASTINTWLFSKNCVAYLRFFEIFAWNFFGTKCYIWFNMFNFAVSAATSSTFKYKRKSKATLSLHKTMQKARKNLASQFAQSNVKFCECNCANVTKKTIHIAFCVKWWKWFCMHAARTNWAKSSQFKFQHVRFFFAFWVTAENWFKLHKVPILPSVLVQSSQIICLLQINFSLQVSERCAFRVQFKNDSRSTRYAFSLRFWVKVRKSFVCYQINLSLKLAIQASFRRYTFYLQF